MCEFRGSTGNGFGDIWWTDELIYFSIIDVLFLYEFAITFRIIFALVQNRLSVRLTDVGVMLYTGTRILRNVYGSLMNLLPTDGA